MLCRMMRPSTSPPLLRCRTLPLLARLDGKESNQRWAAECCPCTPYNDVRKWWKTLWFWTFAILVVWDGTGPKVTLKLLSKWTISKPSKYIQIFSKHFWLQINFEYDHSIVFVKAWRQPCIRRYWWSWAGTTELICLQCFVVRAVFSSPIEVKADCENMFSLSHPY